MRHVGILGGSFDPIHRGHIALAQTALNAFGLDSVRLMPCAQQALKARKPTPAADRCAMLRLAIAGDSRLELDCRELNRGGITYTYDTLKELKQEEPTTQFWFIIGADSAQSFPRWYRADELLDLCNFIVFERPGCRLKAEGTDPRLLRYRLDGPLVDVSSTDIRRAVAEKRDFRYAMGVLEERYLEGRSLYKKEV